MKRTLRSLVALEDSYVASATNLPSITTARESNEVALLRHWGRGSWPADNFTLSEHLDDRERHEHARNEREAFTYAVLNPEGTRCLIGVTRNAKETK